MSDDVVIMFAKAPVAGQVKTRLVGELLAEEAAACHRAFLLDLGHKLAGIEGITRRLAFAGPRDHEVFETLAQGGMERVEQGEGDLGARLHRVSASSFAQGAERVVIIGSDSPTLPAAAIGEAFRALERVDVVFGPSFDGGYYLVGMRQVEVAIFEGIAWSTDRVLAQSLERCRQESRLSELLAFWYDVDTFEDLTTLRTHLLSYLRWQHPHDHVETIAVLEHLADQGRFPAS